MELWLEVVNMGNRYLSEDGNGHPLKVEELDQVHPVERRILYCGSHESLRLIKRTRCRCGVPLLTSTTIEGLGLTCCQVASGVSSRNSLTDHISFQFTPLAKSKLCILPADDNVHREKSVECHIRCCPAPFHSQHADFWQNLLFRPSAGVSRSL